MAKPLSTEAAFERIPFRMHPRVFGALGADLVTNDVVAVIELVKNSYDAFASNVWVRLGIDGERRQFLEIEDDGQGMTHDIITDVWCLVATPFKEGNRVVKRGSKTRRVVGEKGLGRLSVARLGHRFEMLTQSAGSPCWQLQVNWDGLAKSDDLSDCFAACRKHPGKSPFRESGTRLRIEDLAAHWDQARIEDLEENLARLISPFASGSGLNILLSAPGKPRGAEVRIEAPPFLSKPKYKVTGDVDVSGNLELRYRFAPLEGKGRARSQKLSWEQIVDGVPEPRKSLLQGKAARCGPFSFEVRAWDIGADDAEEIADKFGIQKGQIRSSIRAHKGISVYRDGVLVLPKSESARDWLGLDLRRVSKVGTRLSTTQLVGYVSLSAQANPRIKDTSDRERLVSNVQLVHFEEILKAVVAVLENERDQDREKVDRQQPLRSLFDALSPDQMVTDVVAAVEDGADAGEVVPIVRQFGVKLNAARKTIQERFVYYSRLATVGTIAEMLVHEIRNRTTAVGAFLELLRDRLGPFKDKDIEAEYRSAESAVDALEGLADTFLPLASHGFKRGRRRAILEDRIRECLKLTTNELRSKGIRWHVPESKTQLAVDPGELDAILLNLITNAAYWLGQAAKRSREIEFRIAGVAEGKRVRIWVHDTGPGIETTDAERIFLPGFTRKPGGIGMGLTVASELVAEYGGRMSTKYPGTKGGASFAFDLPLVD
jgi:signal transduction histidine kinase